MTLEWREKIIESFSRFSECWNDPFFSLKAGCPLNENAESVLDLSSQQSVFIYTFKMKLPSKGRKKKKKCC